MLTDVLGALVKIKNQYPTQCGGTIKIGKECKKYLLAHPEVEPFLEEAIGKTILPSDASKLEITIDLKRPIGRSECVPTDEVFVNEETLFACRINRVAPSRIIINEVGEETSFISMRAHHKNGCYHLHSSWIGTMVPKEPWDKALTAPEEIAESITFWRNHALIYNSTTMGKPFVSAWNLILRRRKRAK